VFIASIALSTWDFEKLRMDVRFQLLIRFCRRICRMPEMTISAAAREIPADRRTVQRYCRRHPWILDDGKVNVFALRLAIEQQKARDARGFPLGKKRHPRLRVKAVGKGKAVIRRTLRQRIEIIVREIDSMTNEEQIQFLRLRAKTWFRAFRIRNLVIAGQSLQPKDSKAP
jgi:hypothetical protein